MRDSIFSAHSQELRNRSWTQRPLNVLAARYLGLHFVGNSSTGRRTERFHHQLAFGLRSSVVLSSGLLHESCDTRDLDRSIDYHSSEKRFLLFGVQCKSTKELWLAERPWHDLKLGIRNRSPWQETKECPSYTVASNRRLASFWWLLLVGSLLLQSRLQSGDLARLSTSRVHFLKAASAWPSCTRRWRDTFGHGMCHLDPWILDLSIWTAGRSKWSPSASIGASMVPKCPESGDPRLTFRTFGLLQYKSI